MLTKSLAAQIAGYDVRKQLSSVPSTLPVLVFHGTLDRRYPAFRFIKDSQLTARLCRIGLLHRVVVHSQGHPARAVPLARRSRAHVVRHVDHTHYNKTLTECVQVRLLHPRLVDRPPEPLPRRRGRLLSRPSLRFLPSQSQALAPAYLCRPLLLVVFGRTLGLDREGVQACVKLGLERLVDESMPLDLALRATSQLRRRDFLRGQTGAPDPRTCR